MSTTQDDTKIVYSTTTGEDPKGSPSLTKEATEPLPPPMKLTRKTTTKKRKPRVVAPAEPLHKDIKVHPDVWKRANQILGEGRYQTIEIIDDETVIVR